MKPTISLQKGKLHITYSLKKDENFKVREKNNLFTLAIFKVPTIVKGLTSMCEDGSHVLFLDYDDICYWIVENDLRKLTDEKGLGPFYVFESSTKNLDGYDVGSYHAICLTKMPAHNVIKLQRETHCDAAYSTMPLRNIFRSWVLRINDKEKKSRPKFISMIDNGNHKQEISQAHLKFLHNIYALPHVEYENLDNFQTVHINIYETHA